MRRVRPIAGFVEAASQWEERLSPCFDWFSSAGLRKEKKRGETERLKMEAVATQPTTRGTLSGRMRRRTNKKRQQLMKWKIRPEQEPSRVMPNSQTNYVHPPPQPTDAAPIHRHLLHGEKGRICISNGFQLDGSEEVEAVESASPRPSNPHPKTADRSA